MQFHSTCTARLAACLPILVALGLPNLSQATETDATQQTPQLLPSAQAPVVKNPAVPAKAATGKVAKKKLAKKKAPRKKRAIPPPPPPPPPETPVEAVLQVADAPRDYLSDKFVSFVNHVDQFFGDERNFQESNDSVLQLDFTRVYGYGGEDKVVLSGRAKIHLPVTEKKLHLLIESDPDQNTSADANRIRPTQPGASTKPKNYGAGVRYEKTEEERWHYSTDVGLQFQGIRTAPFTRARVSYTIPLQDDWRMKAVETLFWFRTSGPGESTQLDFERNLNEALLFRTSSNATWLHDTQNMDMRQDLSFFHTLNQRTALLYQASLTGVSQPQPQVTDLVLLVLCRYRLHHDWMYLELSPQLHNPRDRNYQSSPAFMVRLEVLFDKSK